MQHCHEETISFLLYFSYRNIVEIVKSIHGNSQKILLKHLTQRIGLKITLSFLWDQLTALLPAPSRT